MVILIGPTYKSVSVHLPRKDSVFYVQQNYLDSVGDKNILLELSFGGYATMKFSYRIKKNNAESRKKDQTGLKLTYVRKYLGLRLQDTITSCNVLMHRFSGNLYSQNVKKVRQNVKSLQHFICQWLTNKKEKPLR